MAALTTGTILGIIGTLLGAGASGIGSYFGSRGKRNQSQGAGQNLSGGGQLGSFDPRTQQQQDLQSQLLSMLQGQLSGPNAIEAEARRQHKEVGLPQLLERFTAAGSTLQGSGVRDAILRSQQGLESNVAAQKYGTLQNLLGPALAGQQQSFFEQPEEPGFLQQFGLGLAPGIGQNLPKLLQLLQGGGGNQGYSQQAKGFKGGGGQLPTFQPHDFMQGIGNMLRGGK